MYQRTFYTSTKNKPPPKNNKKQTSKETKKEAKTNKKYKYKLNIFVISKFITTQHHLFELELFLLNNVA